MGRESSQPATYEDENGWDGTMAPLTLTNAESCAEHDDVCTQLLAILGKDLVALDVGDGIALEQFEVGAVERFVVAEHRYDGCKTVSEVSTFGVPTHPESKIRRLAAMSKSGVKSSQYFLGALLFMLK